MEKGARSHLGETVKTHRCPFNVGTRASVLGRGDLSPAAA